MYVCMGVYIHTYAIVAPNESQPANPIANRCRTAALPRCRASPGIGLFHGLHPKIRRHQGLGVLQFGGHLICLTGKRAQKGGGIGGHGGLVLSRNIINKHHHHHHSENVAKTPISVVEVVENRNQTKTIRCDMVWSLDYFRFRIPMLFHVGIGDGFGAVYWLLMSSHIKVFWLRLK